MTAKQTTVNNSKCRNQHYTWKLSTALVLYGCGIKRAETFMQTHSGITLKFPH